MRRHEGVEAQRGGRRRSTTATARSTSSGRATRSRVHPAASSRSTRSRTGCSAPRSCASGEWVAAHGVDAEGRGAPRATSCCGRRRAPGRRPGPRSAQPGETELEAARRLAVALDHTTLAIQGPPGSGKTYTGARMILSLVAAGKRVGISAQQPQGHRQLHRRRAGAPRDEEGVTVRIAQKISEDGQGVDVRRT